MLTAVALCVSVWAVFTTRLAVGLNEGRERFPVAASGVAIIYSGVLFVSLYVVWMAGFQLVGPPFRFPISIY